MRNRDLYILTFVIFQCIIRAYTDTIKVGILHSLSNSMAVSEVVLKDTILMLIEEQNAKGGLLGKQIEPIVLDPESNWPLFAKQARQLLVEDKVSVVFGCWTSVSRKSVLQVFEENNGLLFYPVQYEGEECSNNIFYTGAAPNQQAIPAVEYLMSEEGGNHTRFVLVGTDYVYPRTTNNILTPFLQSKGISSDDILLIYTTFGYSDWYDIIQEIKSFSEQGKSMNKKTAVISTINGDANIWFYQELAKQNLTADETPVVAFSVGEGEIAGISSVHYPALKGHLAAWNYFMTINNSLNNDFIKRWQDFKQNPNAIVNDPMEAHYIGFKMWVNAVRQTGTTDIGAVRQALYGQEVTSLSGYNVVLHSNHHLEKPVMIGKIDVNGKINAVWQTPPIVATPWSPYINPDSPTCDWTYPWVCSKCTEPTYQDV